MIELSINAWDSKSELLKHLETSKSVLIGEQSEGLRQFFSLELNSGVVGICSHNDSLRPSLLQITNRNLLLIGVDEGLVAIDIDRIEIIKYFDLGSQFFELLKLSDELLLVVFELGVLCLSADIDIIWKKDTDVVEEFSFDPSVGISLETMDGDIILSLDGEETGSNAQSKD